MPTLRLALKSPCSVVRMGEAEILPYSVRTKTEGWCQMRVWTIDRNPVPILLFSILVCLGASKGKDTPSSPGVQPSRTPVIETWAGVPGVAASGGEDIDQRAAPLYFPIDVALLADGSAYIVDWGNHRIRLGKNGRSSTVIGSGLFGEPVDGQATDARLNHPTDVQILADGSAMVAAWQNNVLLHYSPGMGTLTRVAGSGAPGFAGDGGPPLGASFNLPVCAISDTNGTVYIMDQANQRIRSISESGIVQTSWGW